jgi:hypothetical protein
MLTKTEIAQEIDKIINYINEPAGNDDWVMRVARATNRLERLRDHIITDVHE